MRDMEAKDGVFLMYTDPYGMLGCSPALLARVHSFCLV